mmetsp:Transcript_77094/g.184687  ORF Transcript_77094/g.184687 Transcript_77094/m.184687 type:complete len:192 (-) Transcript_77094:59-634(-)
MFAEHLAECRALAGHASEELQRLRTAPVSDRASLSATVFSLLKQADDSLQSLQLEAKSAPPRERASLAKEEQALREELRAKAKELEEARRELLLGGGDGSGGNTEKLFLARDERRKAAAVTSSLQRGTDRLKEANKISMETEDIGVKTLQDLRSQREGIIRMKDNTHDVGANLADAERAVKELDKQSCTVM